MSPTTNPTSLNKAQQYAALQGIDFFLGNDPTILLKMQISLL